MTKEKKIQFGGWTKRDWRDIRQLLHREWLEEVLDEIKESPQRYEGGNGYNEPTSAIDEKIGTQELLSPDIGEVHRFPDPLGLGEFGSGCMCNLGVRSVPI